MTSGSVNLSHRKGSITALSTGSDNVVNLYLLKGADLTLMYLVEP